MRSLGWLTLGVGSDRNREAFAAAQSALRGGALETVRRDLAATERMLAEATDLNHSRTYDLGSRLSELDGAEAQLHGFRHLLESGAELRVYVLTWNGARWITGPDGVEFGRIVPSLIPADLRAWVGDCAAEDAALAARGEWSAEPLRTGSGAPIAGAPLGAERRVRWSPDRGPSERRAVRIAARVS